MAHEQPVAVSINAGHVLANADLLKVVLLLFQVRTPKIREMPVFLGHGTSDPLIPLALAQSTANLLRQKGFSALDFRTYPGVQHSIGPQELQDIRAFILKVLPEQAAKPPTLYVIVPLSMF